MILSWENRCVCVYIEMLKEKIWFMLQGSQMIINIGSHREFIDLYEFDNHLKVYKIILKTFKGFKDRCRRNGRGDDLLRL